MISKVTNGITSWLIRCEAIDEADRELYEYAVHSLWLNIAPIFLVLLLGGVMERIKEGLLLIIPFLAIRKYGGGFHAKKESTCLVSSSLLLALCVYLTGLLTYGIVLNSLVIVSIISLMVFSPIDTENRRLDAEEKKSYKFLTCVLVLIVAVVYLMLVMCHAYNYAVCIAIGIMLSAGVQVPCILRRIMKIEY
ncbi:MAG: accessory gene regulator B family protein [Lachnospiraceae bacterium]|nr:accessory gene regulator B family protein [Lachnospiraceae bacterium]